MSDCLAENEKEALKEFKGNSIFESCHISEKDCLKFLAARKFNVQRSLELYLSHQNIRDKEDLLNVDPWDEEVRKELISAKLTIFPEGDHEGAAVLLLTASLHFPNLTTHRAVLKGLVIQLDCALESLEAQRKGIVLIYDMTNSKFQNFDYELSKKILNMLKGSYPARLKKVLIVMAPLWFKAPFKVLRHFIQEKLRKRVHVIHPSDLLNHLPMTSIPFWLGGTLHLNHRAWIVRCLNSAAKFEHKSRLLPHIMDPISGTPLSLNNSTQKQIDKYFEGVCDGPFTYGIMQRLNGFVAMGESVNEETSEGNVISLPTLSSTSSLTCLKTMTDSFFESDEDVHNDNGNEKFNKPLKVKDHIENEMDDILYINLCASKDINSRQDEVLHVGSRKRSASSENVEPAKRRHSFDKSKDNRVILPNAFNNDLSFSDESSSDESSEPVIMEQDISHFSGRALSPSQMFKYWMIAGYEGLREEYFTLASEPPSGSFLTCRMKTNLHRNRYSDIPCLDETRVQLLEPSPDGSDYINANFVDGYNRQKAYISTQGPLQRTLNDFWQMVWEQTVLVVVMTTRILERGRIKCDQYWPIDVSDAEQYGKIAVLNSGIEEKGDCIVTTLNLQDVQTKETRELKHVHFVGWPDHGTPSSEDTFLDVLESVQHIQEEQISKYHSSQPNSHHQSPNHPLLVHCSAGIGRTGTFIALDMLSRSLKDTGYADIQGTIRRIRNQRALSIQTPEQYLFCYEVLLCYAKRAGLFRHDGELNDTNGN